MQDSKLNAITAVLGTFRDTAAAFLLTPQEQIAPDAVAAVSLLYQQRASGNSFNTPSNSHIWRTFATASTICLCMNKYSGPATMACKSTARFLSWIQALIGFECYLPCQTACALSWNTTRMPMRLPSYCICSADGKRK